MSTRPAVIFPEWRDTPLGRAALPVPRAGGGHRLPHRQALARRRRQGSRALPGLLPRGDRARRRDAALQGAWRPDRGDAGRLALRLLPLLDPQDLARAGRSASGSSSTCSSPIRSATRPATWRAIWGRNFPYPCQILYLPQNANSAHAAEYLRGEYAACADAIEAVAGRPVTDDALRALDRGLQREPRAAAASSIASSARSPWLVSADDAYALVAVGGLVPREEHNELLRTVLPHARGAGSQAPRQDPSASSRAASASNRRST